MCGTKLAIKHEKSMTFSTMEIMEQQDEGELGIRSCESKAGNKIRVGSYDSRKKMKMKSNATPDASK